MKFTSKILSALLVLLFSALLCSNMILKHAYDKVDKSDNYWNYETVLQQPFKYLKITGGNSTQIAYEQSNKYSVRILQEWKSWFKGEIKAHVVNDTLYINFDYVADNLYNKFWTESRTTVRIFSPELLSVDGFNTNLEMFKLNQKNITVNMAGKSKFEIESMIPSLDSVNISLKDSSIVVFEMSPFYIPVASSAGLKNIASQSNDSNIYKNTTAQQIVTKEAMFIHAVNADLKGYTLLDLGHAQIQSLKLQIADSSSIILSGGALNRRIN
jgi:hypothetical protein